MDMKKILQAFDGASTKPVEGASDMSKFVQIVTEGANPHKVSLPVQMAMQHYAEPKKEKTVKESIIGPYLKLVEEEQAEKEAEKKQIIKQYASIIAERVMMKESKSIEESISNEEGGGAVDTVTMDVPLMIRLFEYAREDAKTDMDLHDVAERLIHLSKEGRTLTMHDYADICPTEQIDEVAPPGKKAERMVKHIKANYAKDGKLSDKEKSIAYATAWKAKNSGKV